MAWFKIDDRLATSSKVLRVPRASRVAAMGLWALAGAWSAHDLTDGFVPDYVVDELGGSPELADHLVKAGLWVTSKQAHDAGYEFVNWSKYQPTKDAVEADREAARDRKRKQRRNENGEFSRNSDPVTDMSHRDTNDVTRDIGVTPEMSQVCHTVPVPSRPVPKETCSSTDVESEFAEWYSGYPRKVGKGQALKAYKAARKKVDHQTLVDALAAQARSLTAKGDQYVPYPATWLNGERWADEGGERPDNERPRWFA